jgi:hypothetical protein
MAADTTKPDIDIGFIRIKGDEFKDTASIDSILTSGRKLQIDFDFSHGGKLINRRIYSTKGQKRVAQTLTDKPLNIDHSDSANSIIGRLTKANVVSLAAEAKAFAAKARISEDKINDLIYGMENLDYEKIATILTKEKLLRLSGWKGVSKITASAVVSDEEAIKRFLDRRFLNFSAEQLPAARVCSICLKDSINGEGCEHWPGETYDGKLCFTIAGEMKGIGAAVVMHPGDTDSILTAMSFVDNDSSEYTQPLIVDAQIKVITGDSMEDTDTNNKKVFPLGDGTEETPASTDAILGELDKMKETPVEGEGENKPEPVDTATDVPSTNDAARRVSELTKDLETLKEELAAKDKLISERDAQLAEKDSLIATKDTELANTIKKTEDSIKVFRDNHGRVVKLGEMLKTKEQNILDQMKPVLASLNAELASDSLEGVLAALKTIDLKKIKNFMDSGLQRENVKPVESPVIDHNDNSPKTPVYTDYEAKQVAIYKDKLAKEGKASADAFLRNVKKNGWLPKNFTII